MKVTYEWATPDTFEELVDVANYVFSHGGGRTDFPSLLPKLYKPVYGTAAHHAVTKEDGHIRAMVGAFPIPLEVAGERLLVGGVGTVSVHPYRRSSGYMKACMRMAHERFLEIGADFGCLGGQRQRYQYFGFDRCGQLAHFSVNKTNVRHVYGRDHVPFYSFRKLEDGDPAFDICQALHAALPARAIREPERFADIQKSWDSTTWAIEADGTMCGYLVATNDGGEIPELVASQGTPASFHADVAADWLLAQKIDKVTVTPPPYDQRGMDALSKLAESMWVETAGNMAVYRFDTTVRAFLKLKASYDVLPAGCLVLGVEGHPAIRIEVDAGVVRVEQTEEPVHLSLSYADALALLFSPFGGMCMPALERRGIAGPAGYGLEEMRLVRAWFPLPIFLDKQDNV